MLSERTKARGFSMMIVMPAVALLSLLTMGTFHLVLDQRHRTSLIADRALAKYAAEMAVIAAECELSIATETPTNLECMAAVPPERIAALDPVSGRGLLAGTCGSGVSLGLCQPQPGQSLWTLARLLDTATLAVEIDARLPGSKRNAGRTARYIIERIPDRWPGQAAHNEETTVPRLYRITAAGFGTDPAVSIVLQTVFRPKIPSRTSTAQATIEGASPIIRPNGTVTQRVYTTSTQQGAIDTQVRTFMLGRLSWRELIEEGLR